MLDDRRLRLSALIAWIGVVHWSCCFAADGQQLSATLEPRKVSNATTAYEAHLRIEPATVSVGGMFQLDCEVRCTGSWAEFYNGFLWEYGKVPAQILVTSANGQRIELLRPRNGDYPREVATPWMGLWEGHTIGRQLRFRVAKAVAPSREFLPHIRTIDLAPGEYYIQAIYNHWLLPQRSSDPLRAGLRQASMTIDEPIPKDGYSHATMEDAAAISEPVKLIVTADIQKDHPEFKHDMSPLHVELRPPTISTKFGRATDVEIRMVNKSDATMEIYNPFLNSLVDPRAVVLALLTADGKQLGDLSRRFEGSWSSPGKSTWVRVPPGGIVSSKATFLAGARNSQFPPTLPPGKYQLELRAHAPVVAGPPRAITESKSKTGSADLSHPSWSEWLRSFPGPEICRSNRVELEILPRTGD